MTQTMPFVTKWKDFDFTKVTFLSQATIAEMVATTDINGNSTLEAGPDYSTVIPDIIKLVNAPIWTDDITAPVGSYSYADSPAVRLHTATQNLKVVILPMQLIHVRNTSKVPLTVYGHRAADVGGTTPVHHHGKVLYLGAGEEGDLTS